MGSILIRQEAADTDENRDAQILGVCVAFLIISTSGLAARFTSKFMRRNLLQVDDYLIIWAYVLTVVETGMVIWGSRYAGLGHHIATLDKAQIISFEKGFYSVALLQPCLLASSKLSILILLQRIFITRAFQITARILMATVGGWYIATSFAVAFICAPAESWWNPDAPLRCGNQYLLNIIVSIPWILTDFAILLAPLPMVGKLHTSTRHKVAVSGLFLIGGLTCVASCIRYRYAFFSITDPTWDIVAITNWNVVEANVTVLCVCLIASKPVMMFLIPDALISRASSYFSRFLMSRRGPGVARIGSISDKHLHRSASRLRDDQDLELQERENALYTEGTTASLDITNEVFPGKTPPTDTNTHRERYDYVGQDAAEKCS